jgi:hypothetical protein
VKPSSVPRTAGVFFIAAEVAPSCQDLFARFAFIASRRCRDRGRELSLRSERRGSRSCSASGLHQYGGACICAGEGMTRVHSYGEFVA